MDVFFTVPLNAFRNLQYPEVGIVGSSRAKAYAEGSWLQTLDTEGKGTRELWQDGASLVIETT